MTCDRCGVLLFMCAIGGGLRCLCVVGGTHRHYNRRGEPYVHEAPRQLSLDPMMCDWCGNDRRSMKHRACKQVAV